MKQFKQYYAKRPDICFEIILLHAQALWCRIFTHHIERFFPRIINIHPSLLPAFPGKDAHTDVLASGVRVSGCTVHVVDAGMDTGPILAQRRVPVFSTDTRSQLAKRIQVEEHQLYPEIIDSICSGVQFDLVN